MAVSCVCAAIALSACSHTDAPASFVCKSDAPQENPSYVATADGAMTLAVDRDNVYFFDSAGLEKVSIGSNAMTLLAPGKIFSYAIALDATNVYWIDYEDSAIHAVPIAGGAVTTVVQNSGGSTSLFVTHTNAYWVTAGTTGTIVTAALSNGSPNTLYSVAGVIDPTDTIIDAQNIYWVEWGTNVQTIKKMPLGGGAASVVSVVPIVTGLAIVDDEIFWNGQSSISKTPVAGGAVTTVVANLFEAFSLGLDSSDNVYFQQAVNQGYGLFRASKSGDCVQTLIRIDGSSSPAFITGGGKIFWIDQSANVIYSAPL